MSRRTVPGRVVVGDATPDRRHETAEPERFLEEEVREVLEHDALLSCSAELALHVDGVRHRLEVSRVDARWIPAGVIQLQLSGDWTVEVRVDHTVGLEELAPPVDVAVAGGLVDGAWPKPATTVGTYEHEHSFQLNGFRDVHSLRFVAH